MYFKLGFFFIALLFTYNSMAAIYKYKDKNGKTIFSDAKPASDTDVEKIKYKAPKNTALKPIISTRIVDSQYIIEVVNPFYIPVEIKFISPSFRSGFYKKVIPAKSTVSAYKKSKVIPKFSYAWRFGDPMKRPDGFKYQFPVTSRKKHLISQSFNGRFSHNKQPNVHAVDIALELGTTISSARGGTVFFTRDNFHLKGQSKYFLDKANVIKILHDDGSYAVYAHILQGSSLVSPGDKVERGDRIARSGSAGFSTGPHLHFVLRRNSGMKTISFPFSFVNNNGRSFTPKERMKVEGIHNFIGSK